jgi:cytochrome c553
MSARCIIMAVVLAVLCLPLSYTTSRGESSNAKALREHYELQEGKRLYERYCRFCHGDQGKGKAYDVTPPPADLTSAAVQQKSDAELTQTIHEGERGTAMGSWKWELSEKDKQNVLLYIRRLAR